MLTAQARPTALARAAWRSVQGTRHQSGSSRYPAPPAEITRWFQEITSVPPVHATEQIDELRSRQLQATLPSRVPLLDSTGALQLPDARRGDPLPKGHHLAYFQPESLLNELAQDGSSTEYNAPSPYLRRMWAGGSFEFNPDPALTLRIGDTAIQQTSVKSVDFKKDMIFVNQQRDLYRDRGDGKVDEAQWAVREVRSHVFRRNEGVGANEGIRARSRIQSSSDPLVPTAPYTFTYTPSAPLLFRFSALTFNGHRIHYDRDWTRDVEGHPNLVVHGPLTALMLVELAAHAAQKEGRALRRFDYRATSPMYVDLPIRLACGEVQGGKAELGAEQDGRVGLKATATFD